MDTLDDHYTVSGSGECRPSIVAVTLLSALDVLDPLS